jgi:hypothetical protein
MVTLLIVGLCPEDERGMAKPTQDFRFLESETAADYAFG